MNTKQKVVTKIESLAFEGKGVARVDGKVVFVRYAVPNDIVEIELLRNKKNFAEGKITRIVEFSPFRIEPICKHFGVCGGCSFQNIPYEVQLEWKRRFVVDAFEKIGKISNVEIKSVLPSPKIFGYRNKMEFSFGTSRWLTDEEIETQTEISTKEKQFALGFHIPERFDKVLNINYCHLQDERGNTIVNSIRNKAFELDIPAYNLRNHIGFLRNLILRFSFTTNELLLNLVTTSQVGEKEKKYLDWFKENFTSSELVDQLLVTTNDSYSPTAFGTIEILKGNGYLFENIGEVRFRISPFAFFQVNTLQANNLVSKVIEYANAKEKIVWDMYSGAGTFSLPLAKVAKTVIGLESLESAVEDAKFNAQLNGIENAYFIAKDLHTKNILQELSKFPNPEVMIIDPPRSGIHKNLLNAIITIKPERIVYVSCNPTTQARDCQEFAKYYDLVEIQPVDMFPHTYHIESIALLVKKG